MTEPTSVDRIPLAHTVRYAARGLPDLPYQYGRGSLVPTEISLTYRTAPDSQLGRVYAYVVGRINVDGQEILHGPYGQHYHEGLENWPAWLTEEARLHDPDAPASPPPADRAALRDRIAAAVYEHMHPGSHWSDASMPSDWRPTYLDEADAVLAVLPAPVDRADACICGHTEQQHFEDACLVCDCGDYLVPEAAREVIARWREAAARKPADRAAVLDEAAGIAEDVAVKRHRQHEIEREQGALDVVTELRRAAAEARAVTGYQREVVHGCPPDGSGLTPCCGRTPFELPRGDRISSEAPVTCTGVRPEEADRG